MWRERAPAVNAKLARRKGDARSTLRRNGLVRSDHDRDAIETRAAEIDADETSLRIEEKRRRSDRRGVTAFERNHAVASVDSHRLGSSIGNHETSRLQIMPP